MNTTAVMALATLLVSVPLLAQETKPVPKDSRRVSITGCTKGYVFTAGPRTEDQPGRFDIPEGIHLRMNGPKKMLADIKAHEGATVEITGLMKKGQFQSGGVGIGGGVRVGPGGPPVAGGIGAAPGGEQNFIDVESWRPIGGSCPSH